MIQVFPHKVTQAGIAHDAKVQSWILRHTCASDHDRLCATSQVNDVAGDGQPRRNQTSADNAVIILIRITVRGGRCAHILTAKPQRWQIDTHGIGTGTQIGKCVVPAQISYSLADLDATLEQMHR